MKQTIKIEGQVFQVEILDLNTRPILVKVDGELFEVYPETENAAPLPTGITSQSAARPVGTVSGNGASITAPIPGVINAVRVQVGDAISAGQEVCVIESMKMNNPICAAREGQVKAILVTIGQQVKYKDVLVELA